MTWLGGKRIAMAVARSLELSEGDRVLVAFDPKLASRLASAGFAVTLTTDVERDLKRTTLPTIPYDSSLACDVPFSAAVTVGVAARERDAAEEVAIIMGVVEDGGRMALVDRVGRAAASRAAMLGGLSRLQQSTAGRVVITSGAVVVL